MVMKKSNHIHASGILTLSTDRSLSNKKSVYCCSSDETFGIWNCGDSGELEVDIQNTANKCQGVLAVYGEDVYLAECSQDVITGVDRQIVVKYGLSAFLPSHPLLAFSLEITALACNGKYLIAGSNDFLVKCLKLQDEWDIDESPVIDRYEYDGVILSISISPDGDFFSVSTADGYVQLRPTLKTSQSAKKSLAKFKVCDQFSHIRAESPRIECVWQPNGKHLYLPSKGCIIAVECANWEKKKTITHPEIANETFSVLTIAPEHGNEFFLAASTIQGSIVVWKQNGTGTQFQIVNIHKRIQQGIGIITSIAFNPQNDNILILAYSEGYLCSMTDAKQIDAQFQLNEENGNEVAESSSQNNPMIDGEAIDTLNDDDLDLDDLETDLGLIKSRFGFTNREDGGGFNYQNINNNYPPVPNYALQTPAEPCATIKGMSRPKIFSIGSTPFSDEGHYLVWNSFGVIKNYKSEGECTIEINFHDSTIHHEIIMDNSTTNYTIGDINADFIALASKRNANKESELYVHHVTSWDHESRKWNQQMDQGEVIECLTLGQQFIAIYTTLRYLRVFTPSGTQRFVISLPGSLVTMCAHGSKIATAYSNGSVLVDSEDDYEHQILLSQYEVNPLAGECSPTLEWEAPLALSPYSKLIWIQFSSAGNLVSMDDVIYDCIVRLYLRQKCTWIPVLVGAKHLKDPEADFLWPISFAELPRGQFRYIYCRNSKYPPINKTLPPITTIPIEIPTINPTNERSKLEAELMANELQQIIARDVYLQPTQAKEMAQLTQNYVANLLKLFSISCQSNRESRAAEIAHRATNSKIVQGLCNYAAKVQRPNLSEKVAAIGRERIAQIELEENEQIQKKRMEQIKTKPLGIINSGMEKGTENDSPIIAPPKILMTKRKISNLDSMLPPKNSKAINKNQPTTTTNPFAKPTEKPLVEKENGNNNDVFVEMGMEGVEDDVMSSIGGENELDSSFCSSIFPTSTSMIMDSSSANNPFKKAKKTPTSTHKNHRGFAEKDEDNATIVDFFDDLTTSMNNRKDKN